MRDLSKSITGHSLSNKMEPRRRRLIWVLFTYLILCQIHKHFPLPRILSSINLYLTNWLHSKKTNRINTNTHNLILEYHTVYQSFMTTKTTNIWTTRWWMQFIDNKWCRIRKPSICTNSNSWRQVQNFISTMVLNTWSTMNKVLETLHQLTGGTQVRNCTWIGVNCISWTSISKITLLKNQWWTKTINTTTNSVSNLLIR